MSKGTKVYSLRIPPDVMHQVRDFVQRNFDRYPNGELTVTRFIVDAILERFGKLDRAKRSAQKRQARAKGGVIHQPTGGNPVPGSSFADTDLSGGIDLKANGNGRTAN